MSIGDSLLDYMSEEEILKEVERTKDIYSSFKVNLHNLEQKYIWIIRLSIHILKVSFIVTQQLTTP